MSALRLGRTVGSVAVRSAESAPARSAESVAGPWKQFQRRAASGKASRKTAEKANRQTPAPRSVLSINTNARNVLVLNTDYRPLGITTTRRGLAMIEEPAKAQAVEYSGKVVRSELLEVELPTVLVMHSYVKAMGISFNGETASTCPPSRDDILVRDHFQCLYCGRPACTIDHVIPRSKGGGRTWDNLASSCHSCNSKKGNLLLPQCKHIKLKKQPGPPKSQVKWRHTQLLLNHKSSAAQWSKYLTVDSELYQHAQAVA